MGSDISTTFYDKTDSWLLAALVYCAWEDRSQVLLVARRFHRFQQSDLFWRWMCGRLDIENSVYSPHFIPPSSTFRGLFIELFPMRKMWNVPMVDASDFSPELRPSGKKNISVYARFSPKRPKPAALKTEFENKENNNVVNEVDEVEVTLPLHQRLAMIRMSHDLNSNRQALKVLTSEGGRLSLSSINSESTHILG
jgi:hypothetical protein